jgi:hypothetical protein
MCTWVQDSIFRHTEEIESSVAPKEVFFPWLGLILSPLVFAINVLLTLSCPALPFLAKPLRVVLHLVIRHRGHRCIELQSETTYTPVIILAGLFSTSPIIKKYLLAFWCS